MHQHCGEERKCLELVNVYCWQTSCFESGLKGKEMDSKQKKTRELLLFVMSYSYDLIFFLNLEFRNSFVNYSGLWLIQINCWCSEVNKIIHSIPTKRNHWNVVFHAQGLVSSGVQRPQDRCELATACTASFELSWTIMASHSFFFFTKNELCFRDADCQSSCSLRHASSVWC